MLLEILVLKGVVAVMVLKGRYSEGVFLPVAVDANEVGICFVQ